jgi:hypothetical protein
MIYKLLAIKKKGELKAPASSSAKENNLNLRSKVMLILIMKEI